MSLDVLVVAASRDYLMTAQSLRNLAAYMPERRRVYLATDQPDLGRDLVDSLGLCDVTVVGDDQFLSEREVRLPGWYRQQVIKLRADRILEGDNLCVLSGDTLLARPIPEHELIAPCGRPYLQVNRYRYESGHLAYERRRVQGVAELLGVAPTLSLELGDFISDLFCFERRVLEAMTERLKLRLGGTWTDILEGRTTAACDQERFGEYTMYAVAALELSVEPPPVRIGHETHVLQLHSRRSFERARFDAAFIHVVDKGISLDELAARAALFGQDIRPLSDCRTSQAELA